MNNQEKLEELKEEAEIALSILNESRTRVEDHQKDVIDAQLELENSEEKLSFAEVDMRQAERNYNRITTELGDLELRVVGLESDA
jgi:predicted  nucleic acid-binding Zn-ribbon protein